MNRVDEARVQHPAPGPWAAAPASSDPDGFLAKCEREHKLFFNMGSQILVAQNQTFRRGTIEKILRFYTMYFKFHFDSEEKYMLSIRYPGYDVHRNLHSRFITELSRLKNGFALGEDVYEGVRTLYLGMTTGHIAHADADLIDYIERNRYPYPL